MKPTLHIVKIGGGVIEDTKKLNALLQAFTHLEGAKLLVHGGGKMATDFGNKMGIVTEMVNGRRVTNEESLVLITMVYGGLVNKKIVAQLQGMKCNAIGLTGADANLIQATIRPKDPIDFGFVGDVTKVDAMGIEGLLTLGMIPVFCAITHDTNGQLLNTNADTIAAEIAVAMSSQYETTLFYCFDKKGVLKEVSDENSLIERIDQTSYEQLKKEKRIADGMLPKLANSFDALHRGVSRVCIGSTPMLNDVLYPRTTLFLHS
ncbi:acetylglutamate kinase [Flavobacteriaceae bacterium F08102]|nr:acetylglutamate kinase [Flavobacteriaceae bacterium F08102]